MFTQIDLAKHRAKFQYATSTPADQARQLAALRGVVMALLGLGSSAGAVAIPGPLGGVGRGLGDGRQN